MADRPEFIQLDTSDDVPSVRDRLSFIHGKRVLLIWPEEGTVLTRKLDLVLIQREAMRRAIRLALVTHDPQVIQHARELSISTFETIGASERSRWKRGRAKVFTTRFQRPTAEIEAADLMPIASRVRAEVPESSHLWKLVGRFIALTLLIVAALALMLALLPGAQVSISLARQQVTAEVLLIADPAVPNIDFENNIIPATRLSVTIEEKASIPTSGRQDLADVPASGTVVFVNQTDAAVTIPAGTRISTSAGTPIYFRTTAEAVVNAGAGQQAEVPIEALQESAGGIGNVGTGLINTVIGDLSPRLTVRNLNPTTGGISRSLNAVSAEDRARLLAILRQQLQARAYVEMLPRLDQSQFLILETVRIVEERDDWTTFSADTGTVADVLELTMRAVVEAVVINERFGQQITFTQLARQIPHGREIQPETIAYERGPVDAVYQNGQVSFSLRGSGWIQGQINVPALQERLVGLTPAEAEAYLASELDLTDGTTPRIEITPAWFGRMPLLPLRIAIQITDSPL